ncbi:BTAD domain-containing putative transcriptional regulator [Lentzea sp. NPDC051213]|uniref:AfsR/SARP family transcriptional regulator n=1 Tax=Lentzea sp. NPDC051213 TaxID=3364126 RepID=UPI003799556A
MLGPLEIRVGGKARPAGSPKLRTVLGVLLTKANRVATHEELIDELWGTTPPASGMANIRSYVARIRQMLPAGQQQRLQARSSGYSLAVEPAELDLLVYNELSTSGHTALGKGDVVTAVLHLERAQALWRGEPFESVECGPRLDTVTGTLKEQWLAGEENLLDAKCRMGVDISVVNALRAFTSANPYRERAWRLLVQSLDDIGARTSALAAYEEVRALLARDLGVTPEPQLRELHRTILTGRRRAADIPASSPARIPRELPADVAVLIGREDELAQLDAALAPSGHAANRPKIVAVVGPGGCGKSALSVHAAHRAASAFPDGQIFVELGDDTVPPLQVLRRVLRSLLGSGSTLPESLSEASAMLRSATAGRRVLLVLDHVQRAEQVLGLIPGDGSCTVLITSRRIIGHPHPDLQIQLGMLPTAAAVDLLRSTSGVHHEESAAIAEACGGLPLALRIAGKLIANKPRCAVGSVVRRLLDPAHRLDALRLEGHAVRDSLRRHHIRLSRRSDDLGRRAARLFTAMSRFEGDAVDNHWAQRTLGEPSALTEAALDCLVEECLVERCASGQYRVHDLLRLYGAEIGADSGAQLDRVGEQTG